MQIGRRMDGGWHGFPVNPYGGKADIASHLEGRVRNVDVIVLFLSSHFLNYLIYLLFFFKELSIDGTITFNQTTWY